MNLVYSKSGVIVDKSTAASCLAPGPPVGEGLEGRAGEEGLQVLPPALVLPGLRHHHYLLNDSWSAGHMVISVPKCHIRIT